MHHVVTVKILVHFPEQILLQSTPLADLLKRSLTDESPGFGEVTAAVSYPGGKELRQLVRRGLQRAASHRQLVAASALVEDNADVNAVNLNDKIPDNA